MTGGGITWNRGETGPCRFWYSTLPVNLAAEVRGFNGSSETFTLKFMAMRPEKFEGCHPCPIAATHSLDVGRTPRDAVSGFRKFSFNCSLKFRKIVEFVLEL